MMTHKLETVLVVEDDPVASRLAGVTLRNQGFHVDTAENAAEALKYLAAQIPEAVVLDVGLPDAEGTGLLAVLLERAPGVPIVVHTGQNDLKFAVDCMRLGATDFVAKSDPAGDLLTSVSRAIADRRQLPPPRKERVQAAPRLVGLSSNCLLYT
ncbi:MAG: response regulator, partial [Gammaproteobacteria bacterium]|nr:response regulator [Gammaproteobacteria bacterium]